MNDADGVVQVVILAQGEAGVIGLLRDPNALANLGVAIDSNDACSGLHGFACDAVAKIERVYHNVASEQ